MPFIDHKHQQWREITNTITSDIYILSGYTVLEATVLNGRPVAWVNTTSGTPESLIPLIERTIHQNGHEFLDLVSPYGYPGMVYHESANRDQYCQWLDQFHKEAAEAGYVSSFIRLHPLYNNFQIRKQAGITQHAHGSTISVNLSLPVQDIRQSYSINHHRSLKKLKDRGFMSEIDQWSSLDDFIRLYIETMIRKQAKSRYFFSKDYFDGLKQMLNNNLKLVMIYGPDGRAAAGGLFTMVNGLAQFHLGGTSNDYLGQSPSKQMMDAAIVFCKEQGAHTLHLGGGYGSSTSDGLFRFKAGFGSQRHSFSTLRFIHRRDIYKKLLENQDIGIKTPGAYFPEYRFLGT